MLEVRCSPLGGSLLSRPLIRPLTLAVSLALGLGLGPASAAEPASSNGSAGGGDSYYPQDGNGGYDVEHYDIHDTYRIHDGRLSGWTDVTARSTQALDRLNLDLMLTPTAVEVDGTAAKFTKPTKHELQVQLPRTVPSGTGFTVRVRYHGLPGRLRYDGQKPWVADSVEAMAINEPHIAPWWFPANDHPSDKASYDVSVRVPKGNRVISNGELVGTSADDSWSTWHWRIGEPISTYLAFFAAGRFTVETGTSSSGLPYTLAVSKHLPKSWQRDAMRALRRTPKIVAWEASQLGTYPFASTGGVVTSLLPGFALENASRPTYPYWGSGRSATTVQVHELAHQWFGDDVSVSRWRDVWLNEGFATWMEWLYAEKHWGTTAQRELRDSYATHGAKDDFWNVRIGAPGRSHLFDPAVYDRGAMTLQALRHRIGRDHFATLLRTWLQQHHGGAARVGQFERLAEQVSGQQLDGFFHGWLHSRTRPARTAANGLA
jgi:aminopeptidase N